MSPGDAGRRGSVAARRESLAGRFADAPFTAQDAYATLDAAPAAVRKTLEVLCRQNALVRLGRGCYRLGSGTHHALPTTGWLPGARAARAQADLAAAGIGSRVTGLDALAPFVELEGRAYPHLLLVRARDLRAAEVTLRAGGFIPLVRPDAQAVRFGLSLLPLAAVVALRSAAEAGAGGLASPAAAWVDLYFERTRKAFPIGLAELGGLLRVLSDQGAISLTTLLQRARSRKIEPEIQALLAALAESGWAVPASLLRGASTAHALMTDVAAGAL